MRHVHENLRVEIGRPAGRGWRDWVVQLVINNDYERRVAPEEWPPFDGLEIENPEHARELDDLVREARRTIHGLGGRDV